MTFSLTSSAFDEGQEIPARYTCQGDDISPPLQWGDVPENTQSLVLIVDDPDAPDPAAPQRVWVHWILYNIPPRATGLPEAATPANQPREAKEGVNDWGRTGYGGPCPPIGRHRYFHKLYALDKTLQGLERPTKADILAAMEGSIIAEAQLMGTYQKSQQ